MRHYSKVCTHTDDRRDWRAQAAQVLWRLGYARVRIKLAATRAKGFERTR